MHCLSHPFRDPCMLWYQHCGVITVSHYRYPTYVGRYSNIAENGAYGEQRPHPSPGYLSLIAVRMTV